MDRANENNRRPARRRTWQIVILSLLLVASVLFAFLLRSIFYPLLIALLLAYIFNPIVGLLERRGFGRTTAILVLFGCGLIVIELLFLIIVPVVFAQTSRMVAMTVRGESFVDLDTNGRFDQGEQYNDINGNGRRDASYIERARQWSTIKLHAWFGIEQEDIDRLYNDLLRTVEEKRLSWSLQGLPLLRSIAGTLLSGINGILVALSYLILIPIYLFYILKGMNALWENVRLHLPDEYRGRIVTSLTKIDRCISAFFRGQMTICVIKGVLLFLILMLLGVRMSVLFSVLYAFGSIIPVLGVVLAFSATEMVVLADFGLWTMPVVVAGVFIAIEFLEGFVLAPLIMGRKTGLHPVSILLSLFIFGELFGIFGMMIAVPLAAVVRTVYEDYILPHIKELAGNANNKIDG